ALLRRLDSSAARPPTDLSRALDFAAEKAGRRAMFVVSSDLFAPTARAAPALNMLRGRRHDRLLLHLLDRQERSVPSDDTPRAGAAPRGAPVQPAAPARAGRRRDRVRAPFPAAACAQAPAAADPLARAALPSDRWRGAGACASLARAARCAGGRVARPAGDRA